MTRKNKDRIAFLPFSAFWLIVLLPKYVQLLFFIGYFFCVLKCFAIKKNIDLFLVLQVIYLCIYTGSVLFNAAIGIHSVERILAGINTLVINCIAVGIYAVFKNRYILQSEMISKSCARNLIILIALNVLYLLQKEKNSYTILGHALYGADWLRGIYTTRFLGFLDYANMVVFVVLFFYPIALRAIKNKIVKVLITLGLFEVIYTTNSRSGLVLFSVVVVVFFLIGTKKSTLSYIKRNKKAIILFGIITFIIIAPIGIKYVASKMNSLLTMRADSNGMRVFIYTSSIKRMLRENPFIGIGIKDMIEQYGYPYGSHSTYIGVFYKAGIVGGMIYMMSILCAAIKTVMVRGKSYQYYIFKISILLSLCLMCVEDIDGTNWAVALMYFLLSQLKRESNNE